MTMISTAPVLHTGRLILTPEDPWQMLAPATLVGALRALGLLGATRQGATPDAFIAGPALGELIGFTGCAVQFGGDASSQVAAGPWLRVPPPSAAPRVLWGRNTRPPRCPRCGAPLRAWRMQLPDPATAAGGPPMGADATLPLHCCGCDVRTPALDWRWGRHAGVGRSLIMVEEVFPAEASPLPALTSALADLGAGPWTFFYVQD